MSYSCKILLDSISETGKRLTTFEITFPRIVLAEFNTHRMFSRNSASSRAIPFSKLFQRVDENPYIPERFPIDGKGIQPNKYIDINSSLYGHAYRSWLEAKESALTMAKKLYNSVGGLVIEKNDARIHKQICNRLLEPFLWHTVIVTATEWDNFFKLRCDENAQYEIRRIANLMYEAYHAYDNINIDNPPHVESNPDLKMYCITDNEWVARLPQKLKLGEWHYPLVSKEDDLLIQALLQQSWSEQTGNHPDDMPLYPQDIEWIELKKRISVARCARVSYLTHDGIRSIEKDLELFERLRISGHWSPFEHVATPYFHSNEGMAGNKDLDTKQFKEGWQRKDNSHIFDLRSGNFWGFKQYRKEFQDENCTSYKK